jgi:hypothetical protein
LKVIWRVEKIVSPAEELSVLCAAQVCLHLAVESDVVEKERQMQCTLASSALFLRIDDWYCIAFEGSLRAMLSICCS